MESSTKNTIIKAFPLMFTNINNCASYKDCKFGLEKEKESTARIVVYKEIGILNAYTLETTFFGSDIRALENRDSKKFSDIHMNDKDFANIGRDFGKTIIKASTSTLLSRIFYPGFDSSTGPIKY